MGLSTPSSLDRFMRAIAGARLNALLGRRGPAGGVMTLNNAMVLRDKLSDPALDDLSVSQYLQKRADEKGLSFPRRILKDRMEAFFSEVTGADYQAGGQGDG